MVAIFGVGATVGYAAHRVPAAAPTAPQIVAQQVVAPTTPATTTRVVVLAPPPAAVPSGVVPDAAPDAEPDGAPGDDAPRGVLEGRVTDSRTGEGQCCVEVYADSLVAPRVSTRADSDGQYKLENLPSAAYTVHFRYGRVNVERSAGVNQLDPTVLDVPIDTSRQYSYSDYIDQ